MAGGRRGSIAIVVASALVLGAAVLVAATWRSGRSTSVDRRVRALPVEGISLRVPSGWVDRPDGPSGPSVVVELEHRVAFGRIATDGMWVSRWASPDPAEELDAWRVTPGRRPDVDIDGHRAQVHVDPIGPQLVRRIPRSWSLLRTHYRFEANGLLYEIGFWDGPASRNGGVRREVLDSVRLTPPVDRVVRDGGLELRVPGTWHRGTNCGECWFAPPVPPAAWVYVIGTKATTVTEAAQRIASDAEARREPTETTTLDVGGAPALRVRFHSGVGFDVDDLVIQRRDAPGRVVILATAWRTPAGRAELDAVVAGLVTRP